jgi:hypothetical protein
MKDFSDLRQLLLAYRLGELSPEDREQLDERIICDRNFSDRIAEAAYDVLDDYRAGRLARAQRRRVEKAFSQAELRSGSDRGFKLPKTPAPATLRWFPLGIASLACLSMGLLLLFIHLHKAQAPPPISATHSAEEPGPQPSSATGVAPSGSGSSTATQTSNQLLAVLLLQSAVARGGTSSVLELGPSTQVVRVQWVVPDGVTARAFTLSVTREGVILKTIAQRRNLQKIGGNLEAEFDLAPGVFAKSPQDARFLFIVYTDDTPHNAVGEYPVIVRARP